MMARYHLAVKVKTLYRVLSDEESQKVTRWEAPALDADKTNIADTQQQYRPDQLFSDEDVLPLLGSSLLKPGRAKIKSASPNLQSIKTTDVLRNSGFNHVGSASATNRTNDVDQIERVPVEVLKAKYDEGYEQGLVEGKSALKDQSIRELRQLISAIGEASEHNEANGLEDTLLSLTLDIASLVIRREVIVDNSLMLQLVKAGIEQLPIYDASMKYVYLHPEDAHTVRKYASSEANIEINEDASLSRGDCRIESGASVVNAGMQDWLREVSAQLGLLPKDGYSDDNSDVKNPPLSGSLSGSDSSDNT